MKSAAIKIVSLFALGILNFSCSQGLEDSEVKGHVGGSSLRYRFVPLYSMVRTFNGRSERIITTGNDMHGYAMEGYRTWGNGKSGAPIACLHTQDQFANFESFPLLLVLKGGNITGVSDAAEIARFTNQNGFTSIGELDGYLYKHTYGGKGLLPLIRLFSSANGNHIVVAGEDEKRRVAETKLGAYTQHEKLLGYVHPASYCSK